MCEKILTHFSLFSGIGGIDLASHWAGFQTIGQCECADYPYQVLEKNFPNVPKWRDIHDVTAESFRKKTGIERPTIISGGFPCQPHSLAGKRLGADDERDLWGELARCIREIRPKWFLGENVRGLRSTDNGRFFGRILQQLDSMGYDVGWCSISAAWVGAVHRRERIFIIAHAHSERLEMSLEKQGSIAEIFKTRAASAFSGFNAEYWNDEHGSSIELRNCNGVSDWMDRLKCLGNAVVPQQVYPILEAIASIENSNSF